MATGGSSCALERRGREWAPEASGEAKGEEAADRGEAKVEVRPRSAKVGRWSFMEELNEVGLRGVKVCPDVVAL